jgi:hypothetical protein
MVGYPGLACPKAFAWCKKIDTNFGRGDEILNGEIHCVVVDPRRWDYRIRKVKALYFLDGWAC